MAQPHFKQVRGKVQPAQIDLTNASAPADPASRQFVQDRIDVSVYGLDLKPSARVATTGNIAALTGLLTIDGIVTVAGDRVLVKNQTTQSLNGIYNAAAGAWARSTDADGNGEVTPQMMISVEEGATNANTSWRLSTTGTITVGTTNLTFAPFSTSYYATPSQSNKDMVALVTVNTGDAICNTGIAATPAQNSYVDVQINEVGVMVGDGVKTADAYFSGDTGTTARAKNSIVAGDKLYKGSALPYNTDAADTVSFLFVV